MTVEKWALTHASDSCFRRFDIFTNGPPVEPEVFDPTQYQRHQPAVLTVAYPVAPALYGTADLDAMEDCLASDAAQIRDALFSPGNTISGHIGTIVTISEPDRSDERVWLARFPLDVIYYHSQSLT